MSINKTKPTPRKEIHVSKEFWLWMTKNCKKFKITPKSPLPQPSFGYAIMAFKQRRECFGEIEHLTNSCNEVLDKRGKQAMKSRRKKNSGEKKYRFVATPEFAEWLDLLRIDTSSSDESKLTRMEMADALMNFIEVRRHVNGDVFGKICKHAGKTRWERLSDSRNEPDFSTQLTDDSMKKMDSIESLLLKLVDFQ